MVNWQRPTRHYAKRVEEPVRFVSHSTLVACSKGLRKRIRNAKGNDERSKLVDIKEEIDFLIEVL